MARFLKDLSATTGLAPGTPVFIGKAKVTSVSYDRISFSEGEVEEKAFAPIAELFTDDLKSGKLHWLNVVGLHDSEAIIKIGEKFDLHPLILEGVSNTGSRPRMEEYDDTLFFTLKMLRVVEGSGQVMAEQVSFVVKEGLLISFQEEDGDVFEAVRARIRKGKGRIRKSGADYLVHALLDVVIDHYVFSVEKIGDGIEDIEEEILDNPSSDILEKINGYKKEVNYLRKTIRPVRELTILFAKSDSSLIAKSSRQFIKKLASNVSQAIDVVETYTNLLTDFLQVYHSSTSSKMNEIMKVLTIFAAIFIPLTFIAGVYGTNFEYLPELKFKYSYHIFWGVLLAVGIAMLRFFRKKKWL